MGRWADLQSAELPKHHPIALPKRGDRVRTGKEATLMLPGSRRRRLVGRGAELEELGLLLDGLGRGENGAVCVTGEPGIGKTSLIAEVLVRADERGYRTLSGRAAEFESDVPFAVFVDALDRPFASLGRDLALADEETGLLASVFPSLAPSAAGQHAIATPDERHRLL